MKKFTTALLLTFALSGFASSADTPRPTAADGEVAGHGYVDLGLPSGTLWATCNIDGESPYYPGTYFAWGETQGRTGYRWLDYEFLEEHNNDTYTATAIGDMISGTEYDAARAQWGDGWRMPSEEDWAELNKYCSMEYKEYSTFPTRKGMLVSGPNGNRIFLSITYSPRYWDLGPVRTAEYWTATASAELAQDMYPAAVMMTFGEKSSQLRLISEGRHEGFAIRPVISRQDISTSVASLNESATSMKYENGVVTISGNTEGSKLTVTDLSGRQIHSASVNANTSILPQLSKGVYILTLSKASKTLSTIKIAVK